MSVERCCDCGKGLTLYDATIYLRGGEREVRCFPCHRAREAAGEEPEPMVTEDDCF